MVAYNFQPQFEIAIVSGAKRSTMRGPRKAGPVRAGAEFRLYTGRRTKACRQLGAAICERVTPVRLNLRHGLVGGWSGLQWREADPDRLAKMEGFHDFAELAEFWRKHHGEAWSWEGWLIRWGRGFVGAAAP